MSILNYEISNEAYTKISNDRKELEDLGFNMDPPLYEIGAQAKVTKEGFLRKQQEFEKKPLITEALKRLKEVIKSENRNDILVNPKDTKLAGGKLYLDQSTYSFERHGFKNLCLSLQAALHSQKSLVKGVSSYLPSVPVVLRDVNYNALVMSLSRDKTKNVLLRSRREDSIYSVASERYVPIDPDVIADYLGDILSDTEGGRGEVTYDGYRTSIRCLWHNYHKIEESGTGDVFRFGIEVNTSDDRTVACTVNLVAWINQCLNYLIVSNSILKIKSIRHIGNKKDVHNQLKEALTKAKDSASSVIERWNFAAKDRVIESSESVREVFTKLIKMGHGNIPGISTETLVERYVQNWNRNPGFSRAHIINAMTRTAHTSTWGSPWVQRELENQAGKLLYVKKLAV